MPQTSLTAWLNMPAAVKEPPVLSQFHDPPLVTEIAPSKEADPPRSDHKHIAECGSGSHIATESSTGYRENSLPENINLRACTKEDLPHLKRLNSLLLPIPYPERFYKEIIEDPLTNNISLLAVWHDDPARKGIEKGRLIGVIRCRLLPDLPSQSQQSKKDDTPMLYLSTLALLSPYRSFGIATRMLRILTKRAIHDYGISSVGAHVWEANNEGLNWYHKRGFREISREARYYPRLDPSTAIVVKRNVSVLDLTDN